VDGWSVGVGFYRVSFWTFGGLGWVGYSFCSLEMRGEEVDWDILLDHDPIIHKQRQVWMLDGMDGQCDGEWRQSSTWELFLFLLREWVIRMIS
jgi:hypothetical protein